MTSLTLRQASPSINITSLTGGRVVFSLVQGENEIASLSYRRIGHEATANYGSTSYHFFIHPEGIVDDKTVVLENNAEIGRVAKQHAWEYAGPQTFKTLDGHTYVWKANFWYSRCTWYSDEGDLIASVSPRGTRVDVADGVEIISRTILLILLGKFLALDAVPRNPVTWS